MLFGLPYIKPIKIPINVCLTAVINFIYYSFLNAAPEIQHKGLHDLVSDYKNQPQITLIINETDTVNISEKNDSVPQIFTDKLNSLKILFRQPYNYEGRFEQQVYISGLERFSANWSNTDEFVFFQIPPGNYNIIINFRNNVNGVTSGFSIPLQIKKPFFSGNYFLIILFLFIGSIIATLVIYILYQAALQKHLESKFELDKLAQINKLRKEYEQQLTEKLNELKQSRLAVKDTRAKRYKMVTVLFSDIVGFTKLSEHPQRDMLVDDLDKFFYTFDQVVKKFNIQKIKTIGDTYICAGGIPEKNRTNPIEVVLAAFEMQKYMDTLKRKYTSKEQTIWDLRMGIHTGPVFANIENKRSVEVWGDTVNIASRVESSGDFSRVNITGMTYELVREFFICQYKGKIPVKYQGEMDMYVIEGFRPKLSKSGIGMDPNEYFWVKLGMIRFDDLEEMVMNEMEQKLPKKLYYHNLKHTIDVMVQVELISKHEDVNEEELLLLKTAALFHDTGFMFGYSEHEELSIQYASKVLPEWNYSPQQIEIINKLIAVTKLPPRPSNLLEAIICDADLDYLGRADFLPVSANLFRELVENKMIENDLDKWNNMQIRFIENHQYFTETAKRLRDVNKLKQLESIRNMLVNK